MRDPLQPRAAVERMAAYHPPTAGRADKLRLDFNENTVGCSPKVAEFLRAQISGEQLAIYPEYVETKAQLARQQATCGRSNSRSAPGRYWLKWWLWRRCSTRHL